MKNEALYSVFGQVLVMALLALLACSVYWAWSALAFAAGLVIKGGFASAVALMGVALIVLVARRSVAAAILIVLALAGLDRMFLAASHPVLNTLIGAPVVVFAAVVALGMASERLDWARRHFPSVLMIVLGLVFIAPVAIIANILQRVGVIPSSADD